jgi:hypothetical protein
LSLSSSFPSIIFFVYFAYGGKQCVCVGRGERRGEERRRIEEENRRGGEEENRRGGDACLCVCSMRCVGRITKRKTKST